MGFLEQVAASVSKESLPYLCKRCYIFPTRRAGHQFRQLLRSRFSDDSFIFPEILTIQDFFRRYASRAVADEFTLLTILYPLHESLTTTQQSFDKFIPWGQQILKDFDEIDKYLVPADKLFRAVFAQKDMEAEFGLGETASEYLRGFLESVGETPGGEYREAFLKTWQILGELYPMFQDALHERNLCYEGMAYRETAELAAAGQLDLPAAELHFCGFNAFSESEEQLILHLSGSCHTETWWDADATLLEQPEHEAGNFLRRYRTMFSGDRHHWILDATAPAERMVTVTGIPSSVGQAQYAASAATAAENTCIVLCDEELLLPLLRLLPADRTNITMGYPVTHSGPFQIVQRMLQLYRNARVSGNSISYYYRDLLALCDDPHLSAFFPDSGALKTAVSMTVPYMSLSTLRPFLRSDADADHFRADRAAPDLIRQLCAVLEPIASADPYFRLPQAHILTELRALLRQVEHSGIPLNATGLHRILTAHFTAARIPFDSEFEQPLQVMGFLETRLQDFERVIILSLNDDVLPGTNRTNTFIPYNIRRSFGMPTFEQFDGINAYHFYRLLKRAKQVDLVYNNSAADNASEKSRFIRQIEYEWTGEGTVRAQQLSSESRQPLQAPAVLRLPRTPAVQERLREIVYSPSSLKLYLKCPVQFYLRYVARIYEPDELQADPDAAQFGNVLHHALEYFYRPLIGATVNAGVIATALQQRPLLLCLDEGAASAGIPPGIFHGKNKLQWRVLERIAGLILEADSTETFRLLSAEQDLTYATFPLRNGEHIQIKGQIDRIDELPDGRIRILDYKTGKVELAKFPKPDQEKDHDKFFNKLFNRTNTDFSVSLQGMIYALLYTRTNPGSEVIVGFYKAGDLGSGIQYLNEGEPIPAALLDAFEGRLSDLLSEIIYDSPYFESSSDEDAYRYSPYAALLGIDQISTI